jgi:hypothetical protein
MFPSFDDWKATEPEREPAPNGYCYECGEPTSDHLCIVCEAARDAAFEAYEDERCEVEP